MATLYDLAQAYLNRGLPDISGIYGNNTNNTLSPIDFGGEEPVSPQGLTPEQLALLYSQYNNVGGDGGENDNNNDFTDGRATNNAGINSLADLSGITGIGTLGNLASYAFGGIPGVIGNNIIGAGITGLKNLIGGGRGGVGGTKSMSDGFGITAAGNFTNQFQGGDPGLGDGDGPSSGSGQDNNSPDGGGGYCFDPKTPIQMADGSTKKIKDIQLGDATKGGEVTGVFQFKATDEIHNYKGVTVAGSHFVKEDGKFIMVKDSPLAVKIDKIPVVYSLDTTGRRIFIKDIEFADYNGDGVAKNFLNNAGVDLTGFDKEVLRQVEHRLI